MQTDKAVLDVDNVYYLKAPVKTYQLIVRLQPEIRAPPHPRSTNKEVISIQFDIGVKPQIKQINET